MGEQAPDPKTLYDTLGGLRSWAQDHNVQERKVARNEIEHMMRAGRDARHTLAGETPFAEVSDEVKGKISAAMAKQMNHALEGCIQIVLRIGRDHTASSEAITLVQLRVIHDWAHALDDAKKLPQRGGALKEVRRKIELLGQRLQQMEFGGRYMSGAQSGLGATYQPSSFAGRSGDAIYQKELERDDDDDERTH